MACRRVQSPGDFFKYLFWLCIDLRRNLRRVSVTGINRIQRHTTMRELEFYREHAQKPVCGSALVLARRGVAYFGVMYGPSALCCFGATCGYSPSGTTYWDKDPISDHRFRGCATLLARPSASASFSFFLFPFFFFPFVFHTTQPRIWNFVRARTGNLG